MKLSGHYFLTSWSGTVNWYWISVLDHVAGMRNPKTGFSISWRCGLGFYLVIITTDELTCVTGLDLNSNFTASLGQLVLELGHPHSEKSVFWCSGETSCDSVWAFCPWSCHLEPLKRLGSILSVPSLQVFMYINLYMYLCERSPSWQFTAPSAFPSRRDDLDP